MSMNFADMPWLVTVSDAGTYGPLTMDKAVTLRERLREAAPERTVEAWAAQAPNLRYVEHPEDAMLAVRAAA